MPESHAACTRYECPGSNSLGTALLEFAVAHAPVATTVASATPANIPLDKCFIEHLLVIEVGTQTNCRSEGLPLPRAPRAETVPSRRAFAPGAAGLLGSLRSPHIAHDSRAARREEADGP